MGWFVGFRAAISVGVQVSAAPCLWLCGFIFLVVVKVHVVVKQHFRNDFGNEHRKGY